MKEAGDALARVLDRAINTAGALTMFAVVAAFGAAGLLLGAPSALWAAICALGIAGGLETLHRQRKAELMRRYERSRVDAKDQLFMQALDAHPTWRPKLFKELRHGQLMWNVIGFEEVPFPFAVAGPNCPRCGDRVTERPEVSFPGRAVILFLCTCGFRLRAQRTAAELKHEVHGLAGTPTD